MKVLISLVQPTLITLNSTLSSARQCLIKICRLICGQQENYSEKNERLSSTICYYCSKEEALKMYILTLNRGHLDLANTPINMSGALNSWRNKATS